MFKLQDCFLTSGIFNDALIKRFKENYDPENGSRLWMTPGHVVYTTPDKKVFTCDVRPLDLLSPSEPCTGELMSSPASVLDIFFETEDASIRMYIALDNGDVQIFEYRALLYEWARVGYFNVNITSPNNVSHQQYAMEKVFISSKQNKIYWCEKVGPGEMNYTLYTRGLPLDAVREITQAAVGTSQALMKNCPSFQMFEISENICIVPHLPNNTNLYLILSARLHLWVFDISGKCLWRGIITEQSIDFLTLCMKIVGLWTQGGTVEICHSLNYHHKHAYMFHNNTLITLTATGEINSKVEFDLVLEKKSKFYILWTILCVAIGDTLKLYSLENGRIIQTLSLESFAPIKGIWSHSSSIPCFGIYNNASIFMLRTHDIPTILNSKDSCFFQVLNVLSHGNVHLYALMKDLVLNRLTKADLVPLQTIPDVLQSKALLLALYHLCRTKGINTDNFPFSPSCTEELFDLSTESLYPKTKLNSILEPLVECYCKIEKAKREL